MFVLLINSNSLFAQDAGKLKNFRFGLYAEPSIAWYSPGDPTKLQPNGAKLKFSYGLLTEFRLNKIASIATGIQIHYSGGAFNILKDSLIYAHNTNNKDTFLLQSREYRVAYATIPITLKMQTPKIGAMTYFGQFGVDLSIKTGAKSVTDAGYTKSNHNYSQATLQNINISNDMSLINLGLNVGIGFEYNFIETTSGVISVNYHNGFTNVLKATSSQLYSMSNKTFTSYQQKAKSDYVSLTFGVIF